MVQRPANGFLTPHVFAEVGGGGEHPDYDHLDVVNVVNDAVVSHAVVQGVFFSLDSVSGL